MPVGPFQPGYSLIFVLQLQTHRWQSCWELLELPLVLSLTWSSNSQNLFSFSIPLLPSHPCSSPAPPATLKPLFPFFVPIPAAVDIWHSWNGSWELLEPQESFPPQHVLLLLIFQGKNKRWEWKIRDKNGKREIEMENKSWEWKIKMRMENKRLKWKIRDGNKVTLLLP